MKRFFKCILLCLIALFCIGFAACGSNSDGAGAAPPKTESDGTIVNDAIERKIVYTVYIDMQSTEIAKIKAALTQKNAELGGYIERNNEDYSDGECISLDITFRVPTEKLDEFIGSIESNGGVSGKRVYTTDITTSYVDATARKAALLNRKTLLENMLSDSSISASDRVTIISEIAEVDAELQSIELTINNYDSMVNYSTVSVSISMGTTFADVFVPILLVVIVPLGIFSAIFFPIRYKKRKKASQE